MKNRSAGASLLPVARILAQARIVAGLALCIALLISIDGLAEATLGKMIPIPLPIAAWGMALACASAVASVAYLKPPIARLRGLAAAHAALSACAIAALGLLPESSPWIAPLALAGTCGTGWLAFAALELTAAQGPERALLLIGVSCIAAAALAAGTQSARAILPALAVAPALAAALLAPPKGTRFFSSNASLAGNPVLALVRAVSQDWSPRLLASVLLAAFSCCGVLGSLLSGGFSDGPSGAVPTELQPLLLLGAAGAAFACIPLARRVYQALCSLVLAAGCSCFGWSLVASGQIPPALAMPLALGMALLAAFSLAAIFLSVWMVMLRRALERRLPMSGLFAALASSACLGAIATAGIGALDLPLGPWCALLLLSLTAAGIALASLSGRLVAPVALTDAEWAASFESRIEELSLRFGLTAREQEVFALWARGRQAAYIEERLGISKNTVKTHLTHIYQKARVSTKDELLALIEEQRS